MPLVVRSYICRDYCAHSPVGIKVTPILGEYVESEIAEVSPIIGHISMLTIIRLEQGMDD
jgi:hypothetical protein